MAESFKVESVVRRIPHFLWSAAFVTTLPCQQKRFNPQDSYTVAVIKYDAIVAPFTHLSTLKHLNSTILLMPKVNILRV